MPTENEAFAPEDFGFFPRLDYKLPDVVFYEKEHASIDKTHEKDWRRLNLYLSQSGKYVWIWYGAIDPAVADIAYEEKHGFTWSDTNADETLFRGYIDSRFEAEIILKAIRGDSYFPQYLGE